MFWILAAAIALSPAQEADVAKALRNLALMHQIAGALQMRKANNIAGPPADVPPDVWGTPFRIDGARITSAGSDGKFEEGTPASEQFAGTEGDTVFGDDAMVRSNRNWLYERAKSGDAAAALEELRTAELQFMVMRTPVMRQLVIAQLTGRMLVRGDAKTDAWGTPLRIEGTRVISAGADRQFDPTRWDQPPQLDLGEDIIAENGKLTRSVDAKAYLEKNPPAFEPVAQPLDPPLVGTSIGGAVKAPQLVKRIEPSYSERYRETRIEGDVILELAIAEDGSIGEVHVRKSLVPDLDMAAVDAVRQWQFEPATRDGTPVPVVFRLTIHFKLK